MTAAGDGPPGTGLSGDGYLAAADTFLAAIDLLPIEPRYFDLAFVASTQRCPWPKAYGGDMVAQATIAAIRSVDADRPLHSMHSYFLRPVDVGAEVRYEVELMRDGRSFATRQIRGYQDEKVVYACLASFHGSEPGLNYSVPMPSGVPEPESLPSAAAALTGVSGSAAAYWAFGRSFDQRHIPGPVYVEADRNRVGTQAVWLRPFSILPDQPEVHTAALAYVCDYTILEPVLRAHGLAWADPRLVTASLDHAMWFHRPARLDDWVLYTQQAVSAQQSRGLTMGHLHDRTGRLMATVTQEGLIRRPAAAPMPPPHPTPGSRRP